MSEFRHIEKGMSSALVATESLRTLDRLRLRAGLSDDQVARRRETILALISSLHIIEVDQLVLDRAAQPMPTELATLDAIHLASAPRWKSMSGGRLTMATHDVALAVAVRAHGLAVVGVGLS